MWNFWISFVHCIVGDLALIMSLSTILSTIYTVWIWGSASVSSSTAKQLQDKLNMLLYYTDLKEDLNNPNPSASDLLPGRNTRLPEILESLWIWKKKHRPWGGFLSADAWWRSLNTAGGSWSTFQPVIWSIYFCSLWLRITRRNHSCCHGNGGTENESQTGLQTTGLGYQRSVERRCTELTDICGHNSQSNLCATLCYSFFLLFHIYIRPYFLRNILKTCKICPCSCCKICLCSVDPSEAAEMKVQTRLLFLLMTFWCLWQEISPVSS